MKELSRLIYNAKVLAKWGLGGLTLLHGMTASKKIIIYRELATFGANSYQMVCIATRVRT